MLTCLYQINEGVMSLLLAAWAMNHALQRGAGKPATGDGEKITRGALVKITRVETMTVVVPLHEGSWHLSLIHI